MALMKCLCRQTDLMLFQMNKDKGVTEKKSRQDIAKVDWWRGTEDPEPDSEGRSYFQITENDFGIQGPSKVGVGSVVEGS